MRIAYIGWGSLIPDPRDLPIDGDWSPTGPKLKIEFSRQSKGGRLTLVIDDQNGEVVQTYVVPCRLQDLEAAREALRAREGTPQLANIGYATRDGLFHGRDANALRAIREWLAQSSFDAAVWTDLPPTPLAMPFTVGAARAYLESLEGQTREKALDYIRNAPKETMTPLRRELERLKLV